MLFVAAAVAIWSVHFAGSVLLLPFALPHWSQKEKADSIAIGNTIVIQIKKYRAKYGKFPDRLDDLVPEFLPAIPDPVAGERKWRYSFNEYRFYLQCSVPSGYPHYIYDQKTNEWYEDN